MDSIQKRLNSEPILTKAPLYLLLEGSYLPGNICQVRGECAFYPTLQHCQPSVMLGAL